MRVANKIAEWMVSKEISHIFGIIGAGNVALYDAIALTKKITIIPCHSEQAAVMAATYYYRTCQRLAPVIVTTGAGSSNALTGVLAASMDSIPVLVVSGNEPTKFFHSGPRVWGVQGYDSSVIGGQMGKRGYCIHEAQLAICDLENAYDTALAPRQGPVWADIPQDIQRAEA